MALSKLRGKATSRPLRLEMVGSTSLVARQPVRLYVGQAR